MVSIIIRAFNEEKHIGKLLESIFAQDVSFLNEISLNEISFSESVPIEVVVVDSGSTDRTREIVQNFNSSIKLVSIKPEDFSFGYSLNTGIAHSSGEYCVIISAHCYPANTNWLKSMIVPFLKDRSIGLIYGKQRGDHRTKFSEQRIFERLFPDESDFDSELAFSNNANSTIRKSYWEKFKFNEELTGFEDLEWARMLKKVGAKIGYQADSFVYHIHEETSSQIFRRYYREALAFREIYPNRSFGVISFIKFFLLNTFDDYKHALKEGKLTSNILDIPQFRFLQFFATYKAYRTTDTLSLRIHRKLFYPSKFGSGKKNTVENTVASKINSSEQIREVSNG